MMDYEFTRYDDDNGRLCIEGVSHSFPMVSQKFFRGDGFAVREGEDLDRTLFEPSAYLIEWGEDRYRIWKLTPKGRAAVKKSKAA